MTSKTITLDALSADQVQDLLAQLKAAQEAEAEAKKAMRDRGKALAQDVVTLVTSSDIPAQTFQSGAVGWQLGGKDFTSTDGRKFRVSVLIRDEATIPAKEA